MKKLLWVGDAGCESGFAKCTHKTLNVLRKYYEIVVMGLNYRGDPDRPGQKSWPYRMYPAMVHGGDLFGYSRILDVIEWERPDVVVLQNDPWNIPPYMRRIKSLVNAPPVVGAIAVDGMNCQGTALNDLARVIFWTKFAQDEAIAGGMKVPSGIVPLGVDLNTFSPGDRDEARTQLGLPEDVKHGFIVGNINRNQPRKRFDLAIRYFGHWINQYNIKDAFLYLHSAPTGDYGYNLEKLARYYGFNDEHNSRLILSEPEVFHGTPESYVVATMRAMDVGLNTTVGEGWGLTPMEMMACGVPQILPSHSALAEWAGKAATMVPCKGVDTNIMSVVGQLMDENEAILALNTMYRHAASRSWFRNAGLKLVAQPQYRWENIGERFAEEIRQVV